MADYSKGAKPDWRVMAPNGNVDQLVTVGVAWNSTDRNGRPYISVQLNAWPWGPWDGRLQLHGIEKEPQR